MELERTVGALRRRNVVLGLMGILAGGAGPRAVLAQAAATPSQAFQAVEDINATLIGLLNAAGQEVPAQQLVVDGPRRPRHVFDRACEVGRRVAILCQFHGLAPPPPIAQPAAEVTPGNVQAAVYMARDAVNRLAPAFANPPAPAPASLVDGKGPQDVLANLGRTLGYLRALGVPEAVPNDVCAIAESVRDEAKRAVARVGIQDEIANERSQSPRSPREVFNAIVSAQQRLQSAVERRLPSGIPGGVVVFERREGNVHPEDVYRAVLILSADMWSFVLHLGETRGRLPLPVVAGRLPTHSWEALTTAAGALERLA